MSIYIKDPATDKAVRELARLRCVSLTEAIREAVEKALSQEAEIQTLDNKDFRMAEIRRLQAEVAKWPKTGLKADKAFYDWLSGEED